MNYLSLIILLGINRLSGERSEKAFYYILRGKKSSQTIQDASWYNLRMFFQIFPQLSYIVYEEIINQLVNLDYVKLNEHTISITRKGQDFLNNQLIEKPIPKYLNGWEFHQFDLIFWERFSLIVQILSNWNHNEKQYYPVQRNIVVQQWTKRWFQYNKNQYEKKELLQQIYNEINSIFTNYHDVLDPSILIYRLSGYKLPGLTAKQIAEQLHIEEGYYYICFYSQLHFLISSIRKGQDKYPLLYTLIKDQSREVILTQSTRLTYEGILHGKSLEDIARIRNLKPSTIEDHIVEIALMIPNYSIDPFVPVELQQRIYKIAKYLQTRKLKRIKEEVEAADYFMIRLVLSKWPELEKRYGDV